MIKIENLYWLDPTHFSYCWKGEDFASMELQPLSAKCPAAKMIDKWIWSSNGMILTVENKRTWRRTCPSATLTTKDLTQTALGAAFLPKHYNYSRGKKGSCSE